MKAKCKISNSYLATREDDTVSVINIRENKQVLCLERNVLYIATYVYKFLEKSRQGYCSEIEFSLEKIPGFMEYKLIVEKGHDAKKISETGPPVFFIKKLKRNYKVGYKSPSKKQGLSVSITLWYETLLELFSFINILNDEENDPYKENEPIYSIKDKDDDFEVTEIDLTFCGAQFDRDEILENLYIPFKRFKELLEIDKNSFLETVLSNREIKIKLNGKDKFVEFWIHNEGKINKFYISQVSFNSMLYLIENFWVFGVGEFVIYEDPLDPND